MTISRKPLSELNLSDNYLFANTMSNEGVCKEFLEKLLHIEIAELEIVKSEWTQEVYYDAKAVRFDIYAKDTSGQVYDIEMQNPKETNLAKRSRYYSSIIDTNEMQKGCTYDELPQTYVIFICTFDPFGDGRHIYTFENFCKENREIALQDEAKKVILSTKGTMDDVSDEMRDFLKYVESSTADMATVSNGSLTRHIHDVVEKVKIERQVDYMTLQEMIDEEKRAGYEEGLAEGEKTGAIKKQLDIARELKNNSLSIDLIAKATGLTLSEVEAL